MTSTNRRTVQPWAPVIVNIFTEDFEPTAITTADRSPKLWLRYVNDTFVLWQHGAEHLDEFLKHQNGQHHTIQFTMEKKTNQKIPFLDVLVERRENKLQKEKNSQLEVSNTFTRLVQQDKKQLH